MDDEFYIRQYASHLLKIADQDYIAARSLFKADFCESYLMVAQQSVEKYLKAILLYNLIKIKDRKVFGNGHDLEKLLEKVLELELIKVFLNELEKEKGNIFFNRVKKGIEVFNEFEHTKYGVLPFSYESTSLIILDDFVFTFRRFCQNPDSYRRAMSSFKIFNGYLENVTKNNKTGYDAQYLYLTWKNPYWGRVRKSSTEDKKFWRAKNPIFFSLDSKKSYQALKDYIVIPKSLEKYLNSL